MTAEEKELHGFIGFTTSADYVDHTILVSSEMVLLTPTVHH